MHLVVCDHNLNLRLLPLVACYLAPQEWRQLQATDVRCMCENEPDIMAAGLETLEQQIARVRGETRGQITEAPRTLPGESRRQILWIWNAADTLNGGEEVEGMEDGE